MHRIRQDRRPEEVLQYYNQLIRRTVMHAQAFPLHEPMGVTFTVGNCSAYTDPEDSTNNALPAFSGCSKSIIPASATCHEARKYVIPDH